MNCETIDKVNKYKSNYFALYFVSRVFFSFVQKTFVRLPLKYAFHLQCFSEAIHSQEVKTLLYIF